MDELIVCDTHHGGGNIILDKMYTAPGITYYDRSVGSQDGERRWMRGLDDTVDGLMLMGHHAKAGTEGAFLHHTWTNEWADFRINGQSVFASLTDAWLVSIRLRLLNPSRWAYGTTARWGLRPAMQVTGTFRQS